MPIDPQIARGAQFGNPAQTLGQIAALRQRDMALAQDQQGLAMQQQRYQALQAAAAAEEAEADQLAELLKTGRLDEAMSLDPNTTQQFMQAKGIDPASVFNRKKYDVERAEAAAAAAATEAYRGRTLTLQEQQERRLAAAANKPTGSNAEQQFLAWYETLTPEQRALYDQGKGRKPDKATATAGAVSGKNPLGLNERQVAALSTQENATLNYAANLTGLGRFEIDRIYAAEGPEGISRVMNQKGKRFVQGALANAIDAVPFVGSRIVDIANSDLVAPREAGASGIAMFQNPTGMITGPDIQSGRAQSPQAIYPLGTQAQIAQQTLEAVRQGRPGQTEFATEADAEAAAAAGTLQPGTRVVIGGRAGTWQ